MISHEKQHPAIQLTKLKKGSRAKVIEVTAGKHLALKLSNLGLRLGAHLFKVSSFALNGPVTVKVGSTTIALGHSMAEKVFVEPIHKS
ncbi:MAG: ferrous iron transport protein A [Candidatus Omnitrophica bacterium]|nr:ferrous iron transport protein A [Candidatus Omnitrophota bacterium]